MGALGAFAGGSPPPARNGLWLALAGVVLVVAALPFAVASAGAVGGVGGGTERVAIRVPETEDAEGAEGAADAGPRGRSARSPLSGLGLAVAVGCGPQLSSADGIEAQTCVMWQGRQTWARTYYRNATGEELRSVLSFMGPGGRSVETHCVVAAADEPETCETPRERLRGAPGSYTAVAEFAGADEDGPLLLRCGSEGAGMPMR
ncbi:hypothetical protein AB0C59_29630 [Streptomyces sp. NPDC048664]|uniref:hypothetical protein n=1 Tax=Streptomyces sp. NPDC048664 TaxID=3154505 RepID=UPI0034159350